MNIEKWGLDEIMMLPDHAFGRRFIVSCRLDGSQEGYFWDISELGLPERCVIWEFWWDGQSGSATANELRLAWGDQLPTTHGAFMALDPVFPGFGLQGPEPRNFLCNILARGDFRQLRQPVLAGGRRLVMEVTAGAFAFPYVFVGLVVSSIPKEIPDWILGR